MKPSIRSFLTELDNKNFFCCLKKITQTKPCIEMMQLLLHKLARSLLPRSLQLPLIRATSYLNFGLFLGFTFPEMLFPSASAFRVQYLKKWWKGGVTHVLAQLHSSEGLRFDLLYSCFYWVKVHRWYNATITPTEQQHIFGARSDGGPSQELLYLRGGALFCSISCSSFSTRVA